MSLRALLETNEITQKELADAIGRSEALVSRLISGEARPNKDTIDAILGALGERLGRRVTYEETFAGAAAPEPAPAAQAGE